MTVGVCGSSSPQFIAVPWVGLQCVIVVFPDHTHLLFFLQFTLFARI